MPHSTSSHYARRQQGAIRLTSNQGLRISHTDDSLKAGERGPTLIEDFHLREKITHFGFVLDLTDVWR